MSTKIEKPNYKEQFKNFLNETRDKTVPVEYRIAAGQLKRLHGDTKPSDKEFEADAKEVAKRNKIEDVESFIKWLKDKK